MMISIETLSIFASKDQSRKTICQPWSHGQHSFATDGIVMVRVPRMPDVPEQPLAPCAAGMFAIIASHLCAAEQLPIVDEPEREPCSQCGGLKFTKVCRECNGDYPFEVDSGYNTYEVECRTCDGKGVVPGDKGEPCDWCGGDGMGRYPDIKVSVGEQYLNQYLLWRLGSLKNVWVQSRKTGSLEPAYFTFDGGDGLIMPMR